jgi:hypothetical protein
MTDGRRLNVALTRQEDASIIICDIPAIDNAKSESQRNVEMTEEAPPPEAEPDVEIVEDSMDSIGKLQMLSSFLKAQKCIIDVDIATITEVGTSHEEALELKRTLDELLCYNCQKKGHFAKECPSPKKVISKGKEPTCNNCGQEGHMRNGCPSRLCGKCHQIGHSATEYTAPPVPRRRPARNRPKESERSKQDASTKPVDQADANVEPVQESTEDKSTEQQWECQGADQDPKIVW